ncbi:uncharacterized protein BKA78DRAFT_128805 [Phyllosticta capitalensis]|uniref:Uncharacterized protein n=1 Tax=Phyllosticta capitalensis TaxID=121624 RepID=A0ABR1YNW8_9PEZI
MASGSFLRRWFFRSLRTGIVLGVGFVGGQYKVFHDNSGLLDYSGARAKAQAALREAEEKVKDAAAQRQKNAAPGENLVPTPWETACSLSISRTREYLVVSNMQVAGVMWLQAQELLQRLGEDETTKEERLEFAGNGLKMIGASELLQAGLDANPASSMSLDEEGVSRFLNDVEAFRFRWSFGLRTGAGDKLHWVEFNDVLRSAKTLSDEEIQELREGKEIKVDVDMSQLVKK